ncbi:MAG: tRNA pseudouridine(13) synthase TruD, partial [Candidatus Aenigmarchaeota archaeon]|nr:tRNA pseudouridine(13) synthase TruD [Candidatus Aenigmarchaeota archaeon]
MDYILKHIPEDFIVEEITPDNEVLEVGKEYSYSGGEGKFLHAVLEKRNIDTMQAAQKIARALGVRPERITYAGVKDKQAVSAQRISFYKIEKEAAEKIDLPNIKILLTGRGGKIALGMLWGNRFTITLRNIAGSPEKIRDIIESSAKKLDEYFPNYFGPQRFGTTRPVSAICGKLILQGKFREAVETYICKTFEGEPEDIKKIRRTAKKDRNKALSLFPRKYAYE